MQKNFHSFQLYLETLNLDFTCIGLTETWWTDSNIDLFHVPGYSMYSSYSICSYVICENIVNQSCCIASNSCWFVNQWYKVM